MNSKTIVKFWKDPEFRNQLHGSEHQKFPSNPAGLIELTAFEQSAISGGNYSKTKSQTQTSTQGSGSCECKCC